MDFTRTSEATTKCKNVYHVWSHFYKISVGLKYHRHPSLTQSFLDALISTLKWFILPFLGYLCTNKLSIEQFQLKVCNGKSELVPSLSSRVHVWQVKLVWSCVNMYECLSRNACIYFQQMVVFLKVNFLFAVPHPPIFIHIFRSVSQACIQTKVTI